MNCVSNEFVYGLILGAIVFSFIFGFVSAWIKDCIRAREKE
jgi:hypothetical protein